MKTRTDLTGQTINGHFVIASTGHIDSDNRIVWLCQCARCGKPFEISRPKLVKTCGCIKERGNPKHGLCNKVPEYQVWKSLRNRCCAKNGVNYKNYGGRGIAVCERWASFENFMADMGPRPSPQHMIDREDNDKGYEPGNCRWVLRVVNNRNRRNTSRLTHNGETLTVEEWSQRTGVPYRTIKSRLLRGYSVEQALSQGTLLHLRHTRWDN